MKTALAKIEARTAKKIRGKLPIRSFLGFLMRGRVAIKK